MKFFFVSYTKEVFVSSVCVFKPGETFEQALSGSDEAIPWSHFIVQLLNKKKREDRKQKNCLEKLLVK